MGKYESGLKWDMVDSEAGNKVCKSLIIKIKIVVRGGIKMVD